MINDFLTPGARPALPADPDAAYVPDLSQVNYLFFSPCDTDDPFLNDGSDSISLVSGIIDNTDTTDAKSRQLLGEGGIAEHEATEVELPNLRMAVVKRDYELTFRMPISNATVYTYLRQLQDGGVAFRFWYQDLAGYLYGECLESDATVKGGILPSFVNVQFPKGEGRDDRGYATIILRWSADSDPHRYTSPVTVDSGCGLAA